MSKIITIESVDHFEDKIKVMDSYSDLIGETSLSALREQIADFQRNVTSASQENRLLRIGVVGQIKRGKSSFLNALLFDGEDVLPKAASPMTAALTRIKYGETVRAEVEFYAPEEWAKVEATAENGFEKKRNRDDAQKAFSQRAQERCSSGGPFRLPDEPTEDEKACMELVEMARLSGSSLKEHLGKTKVLEEVGNISELNQILADYVGSAGRFTPIVKSSSLALNLPVLENIEVIDTPGINDPIVSRSRVTQQFMGQCDVIFFLSNCGQFLDQADMGLLAQNIPARGIDDICLIGSLFDSVLLDDGYKYESLGWEHSLFL